MQADRSFNKKKKDNINKNEFVNSSNSNIASSSVISASLKTEEEQIQSDNVGLTRNFNKKSHLTNPVHFNNQKEYISANQLTDNDGSDN